MRRTVLQPVYAGRYAGIGGAEVYWIEDRPIAGFALCVGVHRRRFLNALKAKMTALPDTPSNH